MKGSRTLSISLANLNWLEAELAAGTISSMSSAVDTYITQAREGQERAAATLVTCPVCAAEYAGSLKECPSCANKRVIEQAAEVACALEKERAEKAAQEVARAAKDCERECRKRKELFPPRETPYGAWQSKVCARWRELQAAQNVDATKTAAPEGE